MKLAYLDRVPYSYSDVCGSVFICYALICHCSHDLWGPSYCSNWHQHPTVFHVALVSQARCKSELSDHGGLSLHFLKKKKSLKIRKRITGLEYLRGIPERGLCGVMRMKPKLQRGPNGIRGTEYMRHLPRKDRDKKGSPSMGAPISQDTWMGQPKPV